MRNRRGFLKIIVPAIAATSIDVESVRASNARLDEEIAAGIKSLVEKLIARNGGRWKSSTDNRGEFVLISKILR